MNSPFKEIFPTPGAQSKPAGIYSEGTHIVPVKIGESLGPKPGPLESPFTTAIEGVGHPPVVPSISQGPLETPFKDGVAKK